MNAVTAEAVAALSSCRVMKRRLPAALALMIAALAGCTASTPRTAAKPTVSAVPRVELTASDSPGPTASPTDSPTDSPSLQPVVIPMLASIQMVTARLGWAAGSGGVYATHDGVHWVQQFRSPEAVTGVDFIDASTGWVVGLQRLYRTVDGGVHWSALPPMSSPLRTVHFSSPQRGSGIAGGADVGPTHGWLVAYSGGTLMKTTDGGVSWSALPAPVDPQTVCFTGPSNGWLGAGNGIYRSTDGGQSWHSSLLRPDYRAGAHGQATLIECAGPVALWVDFEGGGAALSHSPYLAYATVDGRTWRLVLGEWYTESTVLPQTAPYGPGSYPGSFSVIDPYDAAFLGDGPASLTVDMDMATQGGAVVTRSGSISGAWWTAGASFVSRSTGWVIVGLNGGNAMAIEATTDGGLHWSQQLMEP
jgi:hypothetical protein